MVPTDFSENSQKALAIAKEMAKRYNASLSLIHAFSPPLIDPSLPSDVLANLALQSEKIEAETLKQWAESCEKEGFTCHSKLVYGAASEVILSQIHAENPILVVMGRTGKGGWLDKILGSIATGVALHSLRPVLIVPPDTQVQPFKHILYATELEHAESKALVFSFHLSEIFDATLSLIKINAPFEVNVFDDEQFRAEIKDSFGQRPFQLKAIEAESVIEGLEKYAESQHADLIVVATKQRDWLSGLIKPSVSKKMILATHIPVLVCHLDERDR